MKKLKVVRPSFSTRVYERVTTVLIEIDIFLHRQDQFYILITNFDFIGQFK